MTKRKISIPHKHVPKANIILGLIISRAGFPQSKKISFYVPFLLIAVGAMVMREVLVDTPLTQDFVGGIIFTLIGAVIGFITGCYNLGRNYLDHLNSRLSPDRLTMLVKRLSNEKMYIYRSLSISFEEIKAFTTDPNSSI